MNRTLIRHSPIDYSMSGEALILASLLPADGPRFLVDLDAGDGVRWSLSRGLIECGWSALLIEGEPNQFEKLTANLSYVRQAQSLNAYCGKVRHLSSVLSQNGISKDFQSLILNSAEKAGDELFGLKLDEHQPGVIVMKDPANDPAYRSVLYSRLKAFGYLYSGTAGNYSVWSIVLLQHRTQTPQALANIPSLPVSSPGIACIDMPPTALFTCGASGQQTCLINGWAFVENAPGIPPLVYLEVRDHRTGATDLFEAHRCFRPDVSAHFANPSLEMCGFRALITIKGRMAGAMSIRVVQMDSQYQYPSAAEIVVNRSAEEYEKNPRIGLARKYLNGTGIEIGALQKPLPVPSSCSVRYVDRMSMADLLHHYPELSGLPLQAPDIVDNGEQLSTIASNSQDFVIANHFFEHSQNPFQTLSNFLRVLRVGGVLFMAVPDKRFTFDFDRPCTQYTTLRETYLSGTRADHNQLFHEWVQSVERHAVSDIEPRVAELIAADYSIHYNVWTVDELSTHLLQARSEFNLPFRILTIVCSDNESIFLLEKTNS